VPYPFIYFPTWREVIDRLEKEHQITFHQTGVGKGVFVQYFEHKTGKETYRHVVSFSDENERLLPSVMRSLCANLRLSPKFFGLELD
jgi:hypothetical protein